MLRAFSDQLALGHIRLSSNRFFEGSPLYPGRFATDWNRSFVMEPVGAPAGAVVLLGAIALDRKLHPRDEETARQGDL